MRFVLLAGLVALLGACGGSAGSSDSGIRGLALIAPTCPVEQEGLACDPLPHTGRFLVRKDGDLVARVQTGKDGRFTVRLDPGRYVLESDSPALPLLKPVDASVREHEFTDVTLTFDSGIR
jgi:hypothetical protein